MTVYRLSLGRTSFDISKDGVPGAKTRWVSMGRLLLRPSMELLRNGNWVRQFA